MKVKVGVIGTGAIGIEHINRINHKTQGAFVTAVSDINVEAASKIAEEIGAQFFKTGEELIASEEVEVV
ncbi:TPA: Gfo/Idh/MocA family oxidoreductase, partial [Enterococcus faecalis]|nr:Gfo/Idh/MocA family oxidoreductase [Enterococcus faecalis]HBI1566092.1 Gfo/Idh/MocA family oxidoreductase [Enterococcus faecalis]